MNRPLFCFDHVSLALPVLPFTVLSLVKTIIFAHGSESWKRLGRLNYWSYRNASLCLANSYFTLKKMREQIPTSNLQTCPPGLSPDFSLNEQIPAFSTSPIEMKAVDGKIYTLGKRMLLLVARIDPREGEKGHNNLINILPKLLNEFPDVQLVFPGPGEGCKELEELAQYKNVASAVFLPGWVSKEVLQRLYQHCYAFVMPSLQEGFGLVYLEAMNYAKPCVGCFEQGAEEIIIHGETGFLIHNPNDSKELLDILLLLLRNPNYAQALGKNGFKRLHRYFTSSQYQTRLKEKIIRVF